MLQTSLDLGDLLEFIQQRRDFILAELILKCELASFLHAVAKIKLVHFLADHSRNEMERYPLKIV